MRLVAGWTSPNRSAWARAGLFPPVDLGQVDASADDVLEAEAQALQGIFDVLDRLARLRVNVTRGEHLARRIGPGRAGDVSDVADHDGAGVADLGLPRRAGEYLGTF